MPALTDPVVIRFDWHEMGRERDLDNIAAGGRKFILDAMVAAKVLPGDGWRWVRGFRDQFWLGPAGVRVTCFLAEYRGVDDGDGET